MTERTFDDFDEYAANYRQLHTDNIKLSGADSLYFARMKVEMLRSFEKDEPLTVLDIGCGDGATELFMQQYFPQWHLNGIDVSQQSITAAKQRLLPMVNFSAYNGSRSSFENQSFDIIFMAGVLHHVGFNQHPLILQEVYRLLKKGGRFYFFEHNPLNPLTRYLVKTCIFDKTAKLLPSKYAGRLLQNQQLKIDKKSFIIFFPRKGILSRLIFLEKYLQWLPLGGQYFIRAIK